MAQATPEIRNVIKRYIFKLREIGVPVERVYLFGSRASHQASNDSDVDLAVVSPMFEKMSLWDRAGFLGKAAWDIPYPLDVLGFSPSQLKKAAPGSLLNHIIKNGLEIR
jgi:predicted nucleotidyltransferase